MNGCYITYIHIFGETLELNKFIEFAKEGENVLSFNKFIPYPGKLDESNYGSDNEEWFEQNWGEWISTDGAEMEISSDGHLRYDFSSDGEPSIKPIFRKMCMMFPKLKFEIHCVFTETVYSYFIENGKFEDDDEDCDDEYSKNEDDEN